MNNNDLIKDIKKIVTAGITAPSGDNSQPWEFKITDNKLFIYNLPKKDNPILNFEQRGSHIAHGAVIENIDIASKYFGYNTNIKIFPIDDDPTCTAEVTFIDKVSKNHNNKEQYDAIFRRVTNRKLYSDRPLLNFERDNLLGTVRESGFEMVIEEDHKVKKEIGKAVASVEEVILENRELHQLLFKDIMWTESQERRHKHGLFIDTMEFKLPQKIIFYLASFWPIMKIFAFLRLPKKIVSEDSKLYGSGAAVILLISKNSGRADFITIGRIMQRLWLQATILGLSIQPVSALIFMGPKISSIDENIFSSKHTLIIQTQYLKLKNIFGLKDDTLRFLMRVGYSEPPSNYSSRKKAIFR